FRRAWYQIGTKTFASRGRGDLLKRGRRACGELVQGNPHVVYFEVSVGLRCEPRISVAHDPLDDGVRNFRLEQQGGRGMPQPVEADSARNHFGPERQATARASLGEGLGCLLTMAALPASTVHNVRFDEARTNESPLHNRFEVEVRRAPFPFCSG